MEIMASGDADGALLNLPYDVPANQFMNIGGQKASTSRMTAVFIPDVIGRFDPDAFRYYLCATMPETADSDFTWPDFVARNNNELVATWGNLVNRVLTMTYRNFEGRVPDPGRLDARAEALLQRTEAMLVEAGEHIAGCRFRAALSAALAHAAEANKFLDETAPWKALPDDRASAARSLYTALCAVNGLKIALSPYVPFSAERLHGFLGFETPLVAAGWQLTRLTPGAQLNEPAPLFAKLDIDDVAAPEAVAS
jgi:methionyl-tRNA synthetase